MIDNVAAVDDEVEAMEDELLVLKQQVEESQRTISRLEESKRNLNEQLKLEKRRFVEADKENQFLRSRAPAGRLYFSFLLMFCRHKSPLH